MHFLLVAIIIGWLIWSAPKYTFVILLSVIAIHQPLLWVLVAILIIAMGEEEKKANPNS